MKLSTLIGLTLSAIAAAARADPAPASAVAEKDIRSALAGWVEAANRGDYKAALAVWAPDLVGWAPEGPDDTYARESAGATLPVKPPATTYALTIDEVIVDGSLAVVRDTWTQTTKQTGAADQVSTFRSFEVWRRQPDQSWKISRWIDGPMRPGAAAAKAK